MQPAVAKLVGRCYQIERISKTGLGMTKQANGRQAGPVAQRPGKKRSNSLALEAMRQVVDGPNGALALREHDLLGGMKGVKQRRELPTNVTEIDQWLVAATSDKDTGNATGI